MNRLHNRRKCRFQSFDRLRRGLAGALTLAMTLSLLGPAASAAGAIKPTPAQAGEKAEIEIVSNAVIDQFDRMPTGYLEVSLRVKTPTVPDPDDPDAPGTPQTFRDLAVALEYNRKILTPVSWSSQGSGEIDLTGTTPGSFSSTVAMPTLKANGITTGVANVTGATTVDADAESSTGLLYLMAETDKDIYLDSLTTLVVVRFQYDLEQYNIVGRELDPNANTDQWTDPASDTFLVRFAQDSVAGGGTASFVNQQLWYRSGTNNFYYADDPANTEGVRVEFWSADGTSVDYTSNLLTMANVRGTTADSEAAYNAANVRFTLVSQLTSESGGLDINNLATILFYDWDDSLIGILMVPRDKDVRTMVNEYVRDHFIYQSEDPALDLSTKTNYTSMARTDNYRGSYPHTGPAPLGTTDDTVTDGANYPLTNKLDYVFLKRPMERSATDPNAWTQSATPGATETDPATAIWDDVYPYLHGWAVVPNGSPDAVWTTLGTGELTNYTADTADSKVPATLTVTGQNFELATFNFKGDNKLTDNMYSVKAVYEPGVDIQDGYYTLTSGPKYKRLTYSASTSAGGATYAIDYQYERITEITQLIYGVPRARQPVVRLEMVPDIEPLQKDLEKGALDSIYMEVTISNTDIIDVELTPPASIVSIDYTLIDKYGLNFMVGSQRSYNGTYREMIVPDSFNYDEYNYSLDVSAKSGHMGTQGFVYSSTMATLLEQGILAARGKENTLTSHWGLQTLHDLNLRNNASGGTFGSLTLASARTTFTQMIQAAIDAGYTDEQIMGITWHQMQYYFINKRLISAADAQLVAYSWCRQDNCTGGSSPITSWSELLAAAVDFVVTPNANALNQLADNYGLRQGINAVPFASLSDFKDALVEVVTRLHNAGVANGAITAMTWQQVQYLLDETSATAIPGTIPAEKNYWWENGGSKSFTDLPDLLRTAYHVTFDGYDTSWLSGLTLQNVSDFLLCDTPTGGDYTDLNQFRTDLDSALRTLAANGYGSADAMAAAPVMEVQHVLLGNAYRTDADLRADSSINYWWITGAPTPGSWANLLSLAWQVYVDDQPERLLANVTPELVSRGDHGDFWLRANTAGEPFADQDALWAALKNAITAIRSAGAEQSAVTWGQFQHALLTGTYDSSVAEHPAEYWWYGGGSKVITNLSDLLEAAWNSLYGGPGGGEDSTALDGLYRKTAEGAVDVDKTLEFINGVERENGTDADGYLDFRADASGTPYAGSSGIDAFKSALQAAIRDMVDNWGFTKTDVVTVGVGGRDWIEIQHVLIPGNSFELGETLRTNTSINYWWEKGGSKPVGPSVDYTWANEQIGKLTALASSLFDGQNPGTPEQIMEAMTPELVTALNLQDGHGNVLSMQQIAEYILDAEGDSWNGAWYAYIVNDTELRLPWKCLQQWILDGATPGTTEQKKEEDIPEFGWVPAEGMVIPVDYTAANACVAELTAYATSLFDGENPGTAEQIMAVMTEDMVTALNLRDGSGNALTMQQIAEYIIVAEGASWNGAWYEYTGDGVELRLPWKCLQQWILDGGTESSAQKLEGEIADFDWAPSNSVPAPSSTASVMRANRRGGVQTSWTTEESVSEDGLTTTTTDVYSTSDPQTGAWTNEVMTTAVTMVGETTVTVTTITVTEFDPETGKVTTTSTTETEVGAAELPKAEKDPAETDGEAGDPEQAGEGDGTGTPEETGGNTEKKDGEETKKDGESGGSIVTTPEEVPLPEPEVPGSEAPEGSGNQNQEQPEGSGKQESPDATTDNTTGGTQPPDTPTNSTTDETTNIDTLTAESQTARPALPEDLEDLTAEEVVALLRWQELLTRLDRSYLVSGGAAGRSIYAIADTNSSIWLPPLGEAVSQGLTDEGNYERIEAANLWSPSSGPSGATFPLGGGRLKSLFSLEEGRLESLFALEGGRLRAAPSWWGALSQVDTGPGRWLWARLWQRLRSTGPGVERITASGRIFA